MALVIILRFKQFAIKYPYLKPRLKTHVPSATETMVATELISVQSDSEIELIHFE
jgi:hypothetical protein